MGGEDSEMKNMEYGRGMRGHKLQIIGRRIREPFVK